VRILPPIESMSASEKEELSVTCESSNPPEAGVIWSISSWDMI
jgi:hypothetical protein